jgi:tRNA(Ile)-lysidine synthase TilS/MesJ
MKNLLGEKLPIIPDEIIKNAPLKPCGKTILLAFSGGNDSRVLAYVIKNLHLPYDVELVAIETELAWMDGNNLLLIFQNGLICPFHFGQERDENIIVNM